MKNNKPLYRSDTVYLENKLDSSFSVEDEPREENHLLPKVKKLIDSGNGDLGRLQSIYDALSHNKSLYHSDSVYLDSKLDQSFSKNTVDTNTEIIPEKILPKHTKTIVESKVPKKIPGIMPKEWSSKNKYEELEKLLKTFQMSKRKLKLSKKLTMKSIYNVLTCPN